MAFVMTLYLRMRRKLKELKGIDLFGKGKFAEI